MTSLRHVLAYGLIATSIIAFLALAAVPFIDLDATGKVYVAGGLVVLSYAAWWLAVPLLGKEIAASARWLLARLGPAARLVWDRAPRAHKRED